MSRAQPHGGVDIRCPPHGGHEGHGRLGCVGQHSGELPTIRADQDRSDHAGQPLPLLLADHDHVVELPDRPPLHPPQGNRLRSQEGGGDPSPGVGVAGDESGLHVVEVEHRELRRAGRARRAPTADTRPAAGRRPSRRLRGGRPGASPRSRTVPPKRCVSSRPRGRSRPVSPAMGRPARRCRGRGDLRRRHCRRRTRRARHRPARRGGGRSPASAGDPRCCRATAGTWSPSGFSPRCGRPRPRAGRRLAPYTPTRPASARAANVWCAAATRRAATARS